MHVILTLISYMYLRLVFFSINFTRKQNNIWLKTFEIALSANIRITSGVRFGHFTLMNVCEQMDYFFTTVHSVFTHLLLLSASHVIINQKSLQGFVQKMILKKKIIIIKKRCLMLTLTVFLWLQILNEHLNRIKLAIALTKDLTYRCESYMLLLLEANLMRLFCCCYCTQIICTMYFRKSVCSNHSHCYYFRNNCERM